MNIGNWAILDTGIASAVQNMALDIQLLENFNFENPQQAILHLYDWEAPSATYGYFIDPSAFLFLPGVEKLGLKLARRPTGGGIIFHVTDFAFSMLIPAAHCGYSVNTLDNYAFVNSIVMEIIRHFRGQFNFPNLLPHEPIALDCSSKHFCMAKPTKYDIMLDGKKVGGGAQRRTKHAILHQGTISVAFPDEAFLRCILLPDTQVFEAMQMNTYALLGKGASANQIAEARKTLRQLFVAFLGQGKETNAKT